MSCSFSCRCGLSFEFAARVGAWGRAACLGVVVASVLLAFGGGLGYELEVGVLQLGGEHGVNVEDDLRGANGSSRCTGWLSASSSGIS